MKLTALLMFVLVLQTAASTYSQSVRLTVNMQDAPIASILQDIEDHSEYMFFYRDKDVDVNERVTVNADGMLVSEILEQIFSGKSVSYIISNRHIVLYKADDPSGTILQQIAVKGKVTGGDNMPLIGVNILIKGTLTGTVTDVEGNYTINVPGAETVLVYSYLGYETREILVGNQGVIDVVLGESIQALEEIIVIGYGTQKRKDITTSVVSVSADEIDKRPITSAAEAIQGKAAGVQVTQPSGKPGAGLSIRVRGSTSIQAGNEPLYVVDGVPTTDIQSLNASDIESMQILKDASSAAIYGARAANGVVLINTKRGKTDAMRVSFNSNLGFSELSYKIDALNTEQYRRLMDDLYEGAGTVPESVTNYTNWVDETFKQGSYQNYQLSVSGGNEKTQFFLSAGYLKDKGIVRPAYYDRYSFRVNLDNIVKKWLKLSTNLAYSNTFRHDAEDNLSSARGGIILSAINTPPFLHIWNPDPALSKQYEPNPYQPSWENPLAYMSRAGFEKINRLLGNLTSEITLVEGLMFKTNLGIDMNNRIWNQYIDPVKTVYGRQENGRATERNDNSINWLLENTLNYSHSFNNHNLSAMAGITLQENSWEMAEIIVKDFPKNTSVKTLNAANQIVNAYSLQSEWAIMSFLGRIAYNYNSKYLFTANFRYDGSSKLAPEHRWDFFPSFSAGWRISAEPFMQDITMITDLKLRAGWGQNGNQEGISDYASYGLFSTSRQPITDPLSGPAITRETFENKDLKWETTNQANIGIDLLMFNSRISFTVDAFIKTTKDLLLNVRVPKLGAAEYITRNDGEMENKGVEFNLTTRNFVDKKITWTSDFNMSFNRNKVTKLGLNQVYDYANIYANGENAIRLMPGLPLGTFFGYVSKGVDPETGMIVYEDIDNTGTITPNDRKIIGYGQPDFTYGFTNTIGYGSFELSIFIQGVQGNDVFNASRIDMEGMYDHKNQSTHVLERWRFPGQISEVPKATTDMANVRNSTRFIEDGSYLRVKNITLSYSLKRELAQKIKLNSLTLFGTAQNLITLTNYSGFDPEVNAYGNSGVEIGVDYGTYPHSRTFIFGFNVEF